MTDWITVVEVCRAMRVEPTDRLMWQTGEIMRGKWLRENPQMEYGLRPKKNGGGSHQFAVYPPHWRPRIEAVIRSLNIEAARQLQLFDEPEPKEYDVESGLTCAGEAA